MLNCEKHNNRVLKEIKNYHIVSLVSDNANYSYSFKHQSQIVEQLIKPSQSVD